MCSLNAGTSETRLQISWCVRLSLSVSRYLAASVSSLHGFCLPPSPGSSFTWDSFRRGVDNPVYLARSNITALGRSARISRPCSQRSSMFDVLEHFLRPLASVSLKSCWIKPFILNASLHTTKVKLEQRLDLLASKLRIRYMLLSVSPRSRSSRSSRLWSFTNEAWDS